MRIDKIGRFLQALGTPASESRVEQTVAEASKPTEPQGSEAVKLSEGFGSKTAETNSDSSSKVERIKAQVQSGTYKVSSEAIANALVRELFA